MSSSSRKSLHEEPLDLSEEAFLKKTSKELVSIISNEWLEESELSSDVIRLDSPSIFIHYQINKAPFDAISTKNSSRAGAHGQTERVYSMELEIRLASAQGLSILCTPPETCQPF